jgi:ketosteroid isomerase-like protein
VTTDRRVSTPAMASCSALTERELTLAREGYEAWNRGDSDWFLEHMTEDAEVRPLRDFDDFDELYQGHKGWKKFWKAWRRQWSRVEVRVERMQDMGDHGVLVLLTLEGVDKESEKEVSIPVSHWNALQHHGHGARRRRAPLRRARLSWRRS